MRRLRRILRNPATVLSLLLCAAAAVLWVRSYRTADWLSLEVNRIGTDGAYRGGWGGGFGSGRGTCDLHGRRSVGQEAGDSRASWELKRDQTRVDDLISIHDPSQRWRAGVYRAFCGFGYCEGERQGNIWWELFVPHWFVVAAAGLLPVRRLVVACRRGTRSRTCRCPACGYDLRATPERCPECGRIAHLPS